MVTSVLPALPLSLYTVMAYGISMIKLTVVWMDGEKEEIEAVRYRIGDTGVWISLGDSVMYVPEIGLRKLIQKREPPAQTETYSPDASSQQWDSASGDSSAVKNGLIILGL